MVRKNHLGRFIKGNIPWNKGVHTPTNTGKTHIKKGQHLSPKTEFKKGQVPWNKKSITFRCDYCEKEFEVSPSRAKYSKVRFCSMNCWRNWQKQQREEKKCEICGKKFIVSPSLKNRRFCSQECRDKWKSLTIRGVNHPNWRGGYRNPYGRGWATIRQAVLKRDKFRCRDCGEMFPSEQLHVHHKIPYVIVHRHDLNNLVTLCKSCHVKEEWNNGIFSLPYEEKMF